MALDNVLISAMVGLTAGAVGLVFGPVIALGFALAGFLLTLGALSNPSARSASITVTPPSIVVGHTPWYRRSIFAPRPAVVMGHSHSVFGPRPAVVIGRPYSTHGILPGRTVHTHTAAHITPPRAHVVAPRPVHIASGPIRLPRRG